MKRPIAVLIALTGAGVMPVDLAAQESDKKRGEAMREAKGTFTVSMHPKETVDGGLNRAEVTKAFQGDLTGTATGQMMSIITATPGSAGYVMLERVTGSLDGRSGSFVLQHFGILDRNRQDHRVAVVPDSGTDGLAGLTGEMTIDVAANHAYVLRYTLPE